ncbi:MAG: alpha/beta fold hydrolase [Colwellia sp.]|nr:alpha/beta fold hydrolase [Colwellia sp.]
MTNISQPTQRSPEQLNYQQLGEGKHIVLIHGLFGSLENLNMVAKSLSQHYCVTSIDVRNHGNSFHQQDMDYQVLAQDVINLLDDLSIEHCHILGHSMGGKIAMKIALSFPERINKLIVADIAPVKYPAHHLTIIEGLQAIDLTQVHKRKDADIQLAKYVTDSGVRPFLLRNIALNDQGKFEFKCNLNYIAKGYQQIMQNISDQINQQFNGDTLFIKGANSDYILPEHQSAITLLFPKAKAKVIQGAGHWLHAEKTVAFNKIVEGFLKS